MTVTTVASRRHHRLLPIANLGLAAAALAISLIALTADDTTRPAANENDNDVTAVDQARWRQDVELMPAGWPATDVMRRAAQQASDGAATAGRWVQDIDLMPSGWPATEVMRRAAETADGRADLGD